MSNVISRLPLSFCPKCNARLTAAFDANKTESGRAPEPGDYTICSECVAPLRFTADMHVELVTPEQFRELDPDVQRDLTNAITRMHLIHLRQGRRTTPSGN